MQLAPDRVVLAAELEPQRHRDARDVASAQDGVAACEGDQRGDRIGLLVGPFTHFAPPGLLRPPHHRQGQILLVLELVVQRAARVARLARHVLEHEVAVAVAREAARGRLEQCTAGTGAPLGLCATGPRRFGLPNRAFRTYMHVCRILREVDTTRTSTIQ